MGLHLSGDDIVLSVGDNGIGLPAERRLNSHGMGLIDGMARALDGALAVDGDQGTLIQVRFPSVTKNMGEPSSCAV